MITSDHTVQNTIDILAPATEVWRALTDPVLLNLWMSDAEIEVITDWKVGSPITVKGNVNGPYEYKGTILQFEPQRRLKYSSWNKISRLADRPENYSFIGFSLISVENGHTRLTLTQSNLIAEAAVEHANFYWNSALGIMKRIIEEQINK